MNSVTNGTRLAEKQKIKKTTKLQKKKLIRKQTEENKEIKQNERRQKRKNLVDEDVNIGRFFELATSNKIYVNNLNLHEIKNEILQGYAGDFELNGLMII